MEKYNPSNADGILNKAERKKNIPVTKEEIESSISKLRTPLKKIDYSTSGREDVEGDEFRYSFSYSQVTDNSNESLKHAINQENNYVNYFEYPEDPATGIENWKRLESLVFDKNGKSFNLLKFIPDDSKVFFCNSSDIINGGAYVKSKDIVLFGDMASPLTLVILLHEIGHVVDYLKKEELGVRKLVDGGSNSDLAEDLRSEWIASAFALSAARSFVKDKTVRKDILNFLMHYALHGYNRDALGEVSSRRYLSAKMSKDYDMDADERFLREMELFDAWEDWKKTEKYIEWKKLPENKGIDEYSEMSVWDDWLEKNNLDLEGNPIQDE